MANEIKPEQVPMPVASAIRSYILQHGYNTDPTELAAAALNAWPEAKRVKGYFTHDTDYYEPAFILPLTEKPDGEP